MTAVTQFKKNIFMDWPVHKSSLELWKCYVALVDQEVNRPDMRRDGQLVERRQQTKSQLIIYIPGHPHVNYFHDKGTWK
jgi:hypothetical protein